MRPALLLTPVLASHNVAARTALLDGPPQRSGRAELPHPALTSGVWHRSVKVDLDVPLPGKPPTNPFLPVSAVLWRAYSGVQTFFRARSLSGHSSVGDVFPRTSAVRNAGVSPAHPYRAPHRPLHALRKKQTNSIFHGPGKADG